MRPVTQSMQFRNQIGKKMLDCVDAKAYSELADMMEFLSMSLKKPEIIEKIQLIKDDTSIEFNKLCHLLLIAYQRNMSGFVLVQGLWLRWSEVADIANDDVGIPLKRIALDLIEELEDTPINKLQELYAGIENRYQFKKKKAEVVLD